jgi:GDP-L-fucose synthase
VFLARGYSAEGHVNVGTGEDLTILELAQAIARAVGYDGAFHCDASKPDGTPRKLVDVTKLTGLGWTARTALEDGLALTYRWYLDHAEAANRATPVPTA